MTGTDVRYEGDNR